MKVTSLTMEIKRDIRHARYNVSQCRAALTAELDPEDDLNTVRKELHDDVVFLVEKLVQKEKYDYWEEKHAADVQRQIQTPKKK